MAESPIEIREPLIHEEKEEEKSKKRDWNDIEQRKSVIQRAIHQTFKSTAHLANLLPTGTVLAFQVLCPLFSNSGHCDAASRLLTEILLLLCGISCFLVSFTDSFKGPDGNIYYGVATPRGLWTFDYVGGGVVDQGKYRVRFIDFGHAIMSAMVFAAVALLDQNVVNCLYPSAQGETKEVLDVLPVGIGAFASLLFVAFPTTRHGIGFPITADH
ncbi:hypothetical protein SUGI_0499040 [Cryptomeria japonica]|uniref:protein DMP4 n=1 Tax=Cryptomeria japonica TaxID=3369 RepID=UPI002408A009|nr:protein DMP4 [Cryptomeria japonica]GLJ26019.1 hypothetical protein SUGI_0499040 [Cryptomeria japonica]